MWQGRWREAESAYARSAVPCAVRRTYSTAFGQHDTTAHRIFIFPLHAIVQFTPKFPVRFGNFGVVAEYSIGLSFAVRSFWFITNGCLVSAASPLVGVVLAISRPLLLQTGQFVYRLYQVLIHRTWLILNASLVAPYPKIVFAD